MHLKKGWYGMSLEVKIGLVFVSVLAMLYFTDAELSLDTNKLKKIKLLIREKGLI